MTFMKRELMALHGQARVRMQGGRRPAKFLAKCSKKCLTAVAISAALMTALPAAASAGVSQIAFTSAVQTVEPSVASGRITIEAQDTAGGAVRGSTVCVQVTSSSASGEFSTNATSWNAEPVRVLSLTISANQYRRNFYYRDSAEGTMTLTARAAPRPEGSTCTAWKGSSAWSAAQQITIDKNAAEIIATREAASAPKVETPAPTPKKKPSSKYVANSTAAEESNDSAPADVPSTTPEYTKEPQVAAVGSLFSDSLWWVAALGLVGAGCFAVVLSRKSATKEWDIVEQKEE